MPQVRPCVSLSPDFHNFIVALINRQVVFNLRSTYAHVIVIFHEIVSDLFVKLLKPSPII